MFTGGREAGMRSSTLFLLIKRGVMEMRPHVAEMLRRTLWHLRWLVLLGLLVSGIWHFVIPGDFRRFISMQAIGWAAFFLCWMWEGYFECWASCGRRKSS